MFKAKDWEGFYTNAKDQNPSDEEDLYDLIEINEKEKVYNIYTKVDDLSLDGWDEDGEEYSAHYVSRRVFDLIVNGIAKSGFRDDSYRSS